MANTDDDTPIFSDQEESALDADIHTLKSWLTEHFKKPIPYAYNYNSDRLMSQIKREGVDDQSNSNDTVERIEFFTSSLEEASELASLLNKVVPEDGKAIIVENNVFIKKRDFDGTGLSGLFLSHSAEVLDHKVVPTEIDKLTELG